MACCYCDINLIRHREMINVIFSLVQGKQCTDYQLGLTPLGIRLYKGKDAIGKFLWYRSLLFDTPFKSYPWSKIDTCTVYLSL